MPSLPVEQQPGNEIVALTICVIALMQALVWWRTREPGMAWFAGAYTLAAVLVVTDEALANATPITVYLLSIYATRGCLAIGLAQYLDFPPHRRPALVLALTLPAVLFAPAFLVGLTPGGPLAALPLLWADFGFAIICLAATRRDPGAGHGLLALGALIGPAGSLFDHWRGPGPHLRQDFPAAAVCLGIILLVVCLMRKSRDSRIAQAHAQRMSNYYATLSHTNQAILRIKEPVALYNEICRICVESAQAKLACVHEAQGNQVWRTASAGAASQILEGYQNPWDMTTPQGKRSYTAQVLQEGRRVICNDYQNEPRTARWRHLPRQHEIRAAAFLPLRRDGRTVAVLMVAAGEVGIFDEALVQLLDEMIGDISFALDNIDREARHLESARQVEAGLERFARLFQSAPVASAIISIAERRVLDVNDAICELHRATREEMIGRTTESLAYRAVREDRERFYEVLKREGRVRNMVVRMTDAQERPRVELMNAEPIDYVGQACLIFMSLDITDMRAAEEARQALVEAQAASHAKTQFLSSMSHELRTPLNAVLGFSGLLRQEAADRLTPQQLAHLDHVQQAGWHLLRLINDVLDLSRIEAGQFGVDARPLALAPLLDEALQMNAPLAAEGGITLHASYREQPPTWACADPTRLRQVLLNVLSNAIKYGRPGGSVQVHACARADASTIEIVDTGLGMSAQQLAHLFEPFNRLGRDGQGIEGTGIGLSLTRQLMQLMSGDVEVSSEADVGTRVLLTLPCADAVAPEPAPQEAATPAASAPRGSVLYIEDNEVNALLVEQLLARWDGVQCVGARDGATGIRMALALRPDLVLLDLQLPDIDGLDVLVQLRAHETLRATPIVVLSAAATPVDMAQARELGAADYWTKPLDFQQFLTGIAKLLPHGVR